MANQHMQAALTTLRRFTQACDETMHEPDQQGVSAHVTGTTLDNAKGIQTRINPISGESEFVVWLKRDFVDEDGVEMDALYAINLATLIALARKAVL